MPTTAYGLRSEGKIESITTALDGDSAPGADFSAQPETSRSRVSGDHATSSNPSAVIEGRGSSVSGPELVWPLAVRQGLAPWSDSAGSRPLDVGAWTNGAKRLRVFPPIFRPCGAVTCGSDIPAGRFEHRLLERAGPVPRWRR